VNGQIKELAEQVVGPSRLFGGEFALMGDKQVEQFGELIVLECADYFGREGDRRFEVDGNWIAKTIKRNFGVER
jgi:hypothetical protein